MIDNQLTAYDKWIAQYNLRCTYKGNFGMWQYGGSQNFLRSAKVKGVSSDACDQNYAYKDYPKIMHDKGLNGYGKEPVIKYFCVKASEGDIAKFKHLADTLQIKNYTVQEM